MDKEETNAYKRDKAQQERNKGKSIGAASNAAKGIVSNTVQGAITPYTGGFEYSDIKQSEDAKYQNDQLKDIKQSGGVQAGLQRRLVNVSNEELPKQSELLSKMIESNSRLRSSISGLATRLDQIVKNTTPVATFTDPATTTATDMAVNTVNDVVSLVKNSVRV